MAGPTENGSGLIIRRELLMILLFLGGYAIIGIWGGAALTQRMASIESSVREQGAATTATLAGLSGQLGKLQELVYEVRASQRVTDASMSDVRRRLDTVEARK